MWRNCCFNLFFAHGDREQESDREEDACLFIHDESDKEGSARANHLMRKNVWSENLTFACLLRNCKNVLNTIGIC